MPATYALPLLFASALSLTWGASLHDGPDPPPKVTSSVPLIRIVAVEDRRSSYVLLLQNDSARTLRRLTWTNTRGGVQKSGVFDAPGDGVKPGSVFDVPVARVERADDEEHMEDDDDTAHRQLIVLERGVFTGDEKARRLRTIPPRLNPKL